MDPVEDAESGYAKMAAVMDAYDIPKFVEEAPVLTTKTAGSLPDELYADPMRRQYPIDSRANVWLSAAYLGTDDTKTAAELGYIRENLERAAGVFGLEELPQAPTVEAEKVAAAPEIEHCYVLPATDTHQAKPLYPVFDKRSADLAVTRFRENCNKYAHALRYPLAQGVVKLAEKHGATIPDEVRIEAGDGLPLPAEKVSEILCNRLAAANDDELTLVYEPLVDQLKHASADEVSDMMDKVAGALEQLDLHLGNNHYYGVSAVRPMVACHYLGLTAKHAADMVRDVVELDGHHFDAQKLASLPAGSFDVLGESLVDALSSEGSLSAEKIADILPTLPLPDKRLLVAHLQQVTA